MYMFDTVWHEALSLQGYRGTRFIDMVPLWNNIWEEVYFDCKIDKTVY